MSGNKLFPAALSPAPFSFSPCMHLLLLASVQRCSQLFPFLPLERSRAAFILLPRQAWGHMETPPPCDCFHTFLGFKEYQLRTADWARVGNPPWQSNLQLMKECWGVLSASCPHSHIPSSGWYPPNQSSPLLGPPFLLIFLWKLTFLFLRCWFFFWLNYAAAAAKSLQSCPTLCDPREGSPPAPPSLGFSRQEHWSGLPFPSPMHESEKWK